MKWIMHKIYFFYVSFAVLAQFACCLTRPNPQYQRPFHHERLNDSLTVHWLSKVGNNERKDGNGDLVTLSSIVALKFTDSISCQQTLEYYVGMGLLCTSFGILS